MKQEGIRRKSGSAQFSSSTYSPIKLALLFSIVVTIFSSASAADIKSEDFARASMVQAWDERVSDPNSTPVTITNLNTVTALATVIQNAPGKWEKGSFTAPSGYTRFVFRNDSQVIAVIGLGQLFLVRGGGGDWEYKKISKELEAKIAAFGQQGPPGKSLQPKP